MVVIAQSIVHVSVEMAGVEIIVKHVKLGWFTVETQCSCTHVDLDVQVLVVVLMWTWMYWYL